MPNNEKRIVELTIECFNLPVHDWGGHSEIWLGIQEGKEVVQEVRLPADGVVFRADLRVAEEPSPTPNFLGPYAHGSVQDRFLYLCWGRRYGGAWVGFRRAKIPLTGLTWEMLQSGRLLARVRCTDAKGGPSCATLKADFVTWLREG